MKTEACGYVRVSTERQADRGVSLSSQRARIEAYCAAQGLKLVSCYADEGLSGGKAHNRPQLQRALADVTKRKAVLVFWSLSRLSRSIKDTIEISERLEKAGADLVSLTEGFDTTTAAGRLVFGFFAVLAQFQREAIGENVKAALGHLRSQNRRVGRHCPFGFDLVEGTKQLVENPREQGIVETMKGWRVDGDSYAYIADRLNGMGQPTKQPGGRWTATSVSRILEREAKR